MSKPPKWSRKLLALSVLFAGTILLPAIASAQLKQPLLSDDNLKRVCGFGMAENAAHAAVIVKPVVLNLHEAIHSAFRRSILLRTASTARTR